MSVQEDFRKQCSQWRAGRTTDETILRQSGNYLHASADWIGVRDWLITMGLSNREIVRFFSQQDFPDFQQAIDDGWGWPEDHPDDD